jgi:RimJ/RimL family protein N-acetyltransferase
MLNLTMCQARPEDAARCIAYVQTLAAEPDIGIGLSAGEFNWTEAQEAQFFKEMAEADNALFLIAEADGKIAGLLSLQGGKRKSNHHAATLGITVAKDYRGEGVGTALMHTALELARANRVLKRIELNVFTDNPHAIHLYEKFGFTVEGQRRKALYRDGRFHDDLLMALLLDE